MDRELEFETENGDSMIVLIDDTLGTSRSSPAVFETTATPKKDGSQDGEEGERKEERLQLLNTEAQA